MAAFLLASLTALLVAAAVTTAANLATTVYLHRCLSHRALVLRAPLRFAFRVLTWVTTGIRPRQWMAVHRKHHAFTDVDGDPHSPVLLGWRTVQLHNVGLYRRALRDPELVRRYARDLPADSWDRLLFDHALVGLGAGVTLLVVVFGWVIGLLAAGIHTVMYLQGNAAVNALGHHFGRRPYENSATNLQWLALLTMGEGLHNNHHAAPTSAKLAFHAGELDPAWPLVRLLAGLRLVEFRHPGGVFRPPAARRAHPGLPVASQAIDRG